MAGKEDDRTGKVFVAGVSRLSDTLAERGARYGDFTYHAVIAQDLKNQMNNRDGWHRLSPDKRQALETIADKIARILNGDPEYRDNWHDIAGYAKLAEDRCKTTFDKKEQKVMKIDREKILNLLEWPLGDDGLLPRMHSEAKKVWCKKIMEIGGMIIEAEQL